jgi:hypothetical protein
LISKKFEKEIIFESSVLAWIGIELKCWIRIRMESIRIHNPARNVLFFPVVAMPEPQGVAAHLGSLPVRNQIKK